MSVTAVVVIMTVLPLAFIAVDVALAVDKVEGNTYSELIRAAGKKWMPLIMIMCFGMGLLAGHWFWNSVEYVEAKARDNQLDAAPADASGRVGP